VYGAGVVIQMGVRMCVGMFIFCACVRACVYVCI
jgi:hypothetical protein